MILYNGKTYKDTHQKELLASLKQDCYKTLETKDKLDFDLVINACDRLTKQINNGDFDDLIKPLLKEFDIPESTFSHYVSTFTNEALKSKLKIELGYDYETLSALNEDNERTLYPLGILFHIAAGNLDILPAYSVIEGLLVGNINILKLPTGDKGVSVKLLSALIDIEPALKEYIYVFDVPSVEIDTLEIFAEVADAIVVWGGDEAVMAARKMAKPNTKLIEWGHKLSFAYANLKADNDDLVGLAKNIITTNQLLCSSAQGIYVDTHSNEELEVFAERFFKILVDVQKEHQAVPFGMKSKNAVELYYEEMVKKETGKKIFKEAGVSVVTSRDSKLETSLLFRNVWVKKLPKEKIIEVLKPAKNYLQTASILAPKSDYDLYKQKLINAGVVRIKKPIEMSESLVGESHDGMHPLRLYTRVIELYKKRQ